jgi:hypothetical protein
LPRPARVHAAAVRAPAPPPRQQHTKHKWNIYEQKTHQVCDAFPDIKVSLEFKPTDENTRFFIVPSTGAALLLVNEVRACVRRRHVSRPATARAAREDRSLSPRDNEGRRGRAGQRRRAAREDLSLAASQR